MMGEDGDDPGFQMLTVTDIMVYFDNCKKVWFHMKKTSACCFYSQALHISSEQLWPRVHTISISYVCCE